MTVQSATWVGLQLVDVESLNEKLNCRRVIQNLVDALETEGDFKESECDASFGQQEDNSLALTCWSKWKMNSARRNLIRTSSE